MEKLEFGETVILETGKEYVCFASVEENGVEYVYLVTNSKPLEVRFARQILKDDVLKLEMIQDKQLKLHLLELFQSKLREENL